MPLNLGALSSGLPGAGGADYPLTAAECAAAWAQAVLGWASGVVPPSTTVAAAVTALEAALRSAFESGTDLASVDAAFSAFAAQVALGMLPAYTAIPPPAGPDLATLLKDARPSTRQEGVDLVANQLDSWLRTGTATLVAPPKTPVPAWT